jgi:hypothetical protein
MQNKDSIKQAYRRAGEDFLASDLECMFRTIKTDEDKALHNLIQKKVFDMIGQDQAHANMFYRLLAHKLLEKRAKKSFIKQLCEVIIGERS